MGAPYTKSTEEQASVRRCRLQGLFSRGWISRGLTTLGTTVSPKRRTPWIVSCSNPPFYEGRAYFYAELCGSSRRFPQIRDCVAKLRCNASEMSLKYTILRCLLRFPAFSTPRSLTRVENSIGEQLYYTPIERKENDGVRWADEEDFMEQNFLVRLQWVAKLNIYEKLSAKVLFISA